LAVQRAGLKFKIFPKTNKIYTVISHKRLHRFVKHRKEVKDSRCSLMEMAIADHDGSVIFHRSSGLGRRASGSINKPTGHLWVHRWCLFEEDIKVPCMTLDGWCQQNDIEHIDLIWADVNGAEAKMLAGAQETLKHTRYLYTEFQTGGPEIYAGGVNRGQLKRLLPSFRDAWTHKNNILFINKELNDV
ncbi:hypothetical protein LCGC14_0821570, partial [marine sediment metagenome]